MIQISYILGYSPKKTLNQPIHSVQLAILSILWLLYILPGQKDGSVCEILHSPFHLQHYALAKIFRKVQTVNPSFLEWYTCPFLERSICLFSERSSNPLLIVGSLRSPLANMGCKLKVGQHRLKAKIYH